MQRCSCAPPACHATPAAEGRNSTHLGNAQDSRHVEFRYPAPRRAWRRGAVAAPSPVSVESPARARPHSRNLRGGFLDLYPHRGSLCRISSVVDPAGPADSMFSTRTRARLLMPRPREGSIMWNPQEERTSARLFWPLRSGRWCLLGDPSLSAAGRGNYLRSVLGKDPSEPTLPAGAPSMHLFLGCSHVWKESLGFAASPRQESCCLHTTQHHPV